MARVVVVGGSVAGLSAALALSRRGHEVTVFHRGQTNAQLPAGVRHVYGDVAAFAEK